MTDKQFFVRLDKRTAKPRKEKGHRQEDMEDFGIAYKYYQRIEAPGSRPANITMKTLLKIARSLAVEPGDLLNFDE